MRPATGVPPSSPPRGAPCQPRSRKCRSANPLQLLGGERRSARPRPSTVRLRPGPLRRRLSSRRSCCSASPVCIALNEAWHKWSHAEVTDVLDPSSFELARQEYGEDSLLVQTAAPTEVVAGQVVQVVGTVGQYHRFANSEGVPPVQYDMYEEYETEAYLYGASGRGDRGLSALIRPPRAAARHRRRAPCRGPQPAPSDMPRAPWPATVVRPWVTTTTRT